MTARNAFSHSAQKWPNLLNTNKTRFRAHFAHFVQGSARKGARNMPPSLEGAFRAPGFGSCGKQRSGKLRKAIGKKLRFDVLHRDKFTCQYCGAQPPDVVLHLDHRLAVAKGGDNSFDNLLTSCAPCNIGKGITEISVSAGVAPVPGKAAPRIEFFWHSEFENGVEYLTTARIIDVPKTYEGTEFYDSEYYYFCHTKHPHYSTYGYSGINFSRHCAATKVFGNYILDSRNALG